MFKSVRIQNFRQFKELKLDNLARINLITGKNNTGKTSLLEALFLLANPTDPEKALTVATLRGVNSVPVSGVYAWGFIFRDGQSGEPVALEAHRTDGSIDVLSIRISDDLEAPVGRDLASNGHNDQAVILTTSSSVPSLDYDYSISTKTKVQHASSRIRVGEDHRVTERAKGLKTRPTYFLANGPANAEGDAERFSRLVEMRRKPEVVDVLRTLDSRLIDLEVLALRPSTVTADLGAGPLVPVGYMGRGFERLLTLILAVLGSAGGIVLVDEIDDGLHYSVMSGIWKTIIDAARSYDVQIFATTHSYECLKAAVEASQDKPGTLAMFRLTRSDGQIRVVDVDDEGLRDAVSIGFEMR